MSPVRRNTVNGKVIEEFYWVERYVVYVDNKKVNMTYQEAIQQAGEEK